MKVILNQTVPKVGKEGQVVTVADGYARNFLFPRGLAVVADKGQIKALEARRARLDAKLAETKAAAEALKEKIDGKALRIVGKAGREDTKLFGAITAQDIVDALKEQAGVVLEKKQVPLLQPIKRLGNYRLEVDLHRDVDAHISVEVYDPERPVEVVEVEETAAEVTPELDAADETEELVEA
ncbi:MAG TPA: 50S ribosomal protein L9 [Fimbriimonadaceae bacterium]|nr:50S ribosomal protein L9 [Fimbriimonadaceae bacterium]